MPLWKPGIIESKDPDAVKKLQWDLTDWLNGLSLASHQVTVSGVTLDSSESVSTMVTAIVSGGTVGTDATVTLRVVRSDTVSDDFSHTIQIAEK